MATRSGYRTVTKSNGGTTTVRIGSTADKSYDSAGTLVGSKNTRPSGQVAGASTSQALTDLSKGLAPSNTDITQEQAKGSSLKDLSIGLANQYNRKTGSTVLSNANKIEKIIPLLDSKANNLTNDYSGANFSNTGIDDGTGGGDTEGDSFDEILGIKEKKKKKGTIEEETDPLLQQQLALLESMQKKADAQTRQSLNSIRTKYDIRESDQRAANESGLASVKQALSLGGSSRYAPISSQGIISATEAAGIKALSALDAEEERLIGEAKSAQATNDYELLEKKMNLIDGVRKEKATATAKLQEETQATEEQIAMDDAIATEVSNGNTNPVQIYNALREQGVNVPLSSITASLASLNELSETSGTGFKLDNKAMGLLLGNGWTSTDIKSMQEDLASGASITDIIEGVEPEMKDSVLKALGVEGISGPVNLGIGATTELDERAIRSQLEPKLMGILNKGAVSDEDRKYVKSEIAFYRDQGLSSQQILDIFSGWSPDVSTPYNDGFRNVVLANDTDGQGTSPTLTRVGSLLANKNYKAAMDAVENMAMTQAKKLDPEGFVSTATTQNYLKKGQELTKLVKSAEEIIGPLDGTWETVKQRLGKSKNNQAAEISSKIAALVADMRHDLSGTAVTDSESQFLEPLIPSLSDNMLNFNTKVKALTDNVLSQHNSVRSLVSLPTVTSEMMIDPKKRLIVYSNDTTSRDANSLDI